jgi:hypothetical protein
VPGLASLNTHQIEWVPPEAQAIGNHKLQVSVDVGGNVDEANEDNNDADLQFRVLTPPDLTFGTISHSPENAKVDGVLTFNIELKNIGESPTGRIRAAITIPGPTAFSAEMSSSLDYDPGLPGNGSITLSRQWIPRNGGSYVATARIVPAIGESDTSNNSKDYALDVCDPLTCADYGFVHGNTFSLPNNCMVVEDLHCDDLTSVYGPGLGYTEGYYLQWIKLCAEYSYCNEFQAAKCNTVGSPIEGGGIRINNCCRVTGCTTGGTCSQSAIPHTHLEADYGATGHKGLNIVNNLIGSDEANNCR